ELVPLLLALGERLPGQQIVQILVFAGTDQHRPKAGLTDAVPLPELERGGLEALEQRGQPAGDAVIDAKLVDHGRVSSMTGGNDVSRDAEKGNRCQETSSDAGANVGTAPVPTPAGSGRPRR